MSRLGLWWGPYLAAAGLLTVAGLAKVHSPAPTAMVLRQAGIRVGRQAVRCAALAEVALGCWALTASRLAAAALAASYLAFAIFVALAMRAGSPVSSCGCFGKADVAPSRAHLVLNGVAAAVAGWAATHVHAGLISTIRGEPLVALSMVLVAGAIAYLAYLAMTALPRLSPPGTAGAPAGATT